MRRSRKGTVIPVGTFVYLEQAEMAGYGIVVDPKFWDKEVAKSNNAMFESAQKAGPNVARIMLLSEVLGKMLVKVVGTDIIVNKKYAQKFTWSSPEHITRFDDAHETYLAMEQITAFAGGPSLWQIENSIFFAGEINKFFKDPAYESELCKIFKKAFPRKKARGKKR